MLRIKTVAAAAAGLAAAAVASTALAAPATVTLTIQHQLRGCHTWAFAGGPAKASQKITLAGGSTIVLTNMDVMPHTFVQVSGPKVRIVAPQLHGMPGMKAMHQHASVTFTTKGVYRFTTHAGEDNIKNVKTVGPDNVLRLTVTVR
jgi:plastocyanin